MSYWHTFKRKKGVKRDGHITQRQPVTVESARPADVAATAGNDPVVEEHHDTVRIGGGAPAPQAVQQVLQPRTYEEKAHALTQFDIDAEAAELSLYVAYTVSGVMNLSGAAQRNLHVHFREVLRRCAMAHMLLRSDED